MTEGRPLAAHVEKATADETIASLKREGCYDSQRRIREARTDLVAVPITREPVTTEVRDVAVQSDPPWRIRDLADRLRERGFPDAKLDRIPGSWAVIGEVIVARFEDCPDEGAVAEALLDVHGSCHTVLAREGITGPHRHPSVRVVAGRGETETVHVEGGSEYALDLAEVMFAPGNELERGRMGALVEPGEVVIDMFAGIGYFAVPMARAGARVTAIERNPTAHSYLLENRERNAVGACLSATLGDCGTIVPRLADDGPVANRIVMGHFDAIAYLPAALEALRPGGTLHLHAIGHAESPFVDIEQTLRDHAVRITDRRVVKSTAPGTVHAVVDGTATGGPN